MAREGQDIKTEPRQTSKTQTGTGKQETSCVNPPPPNPNPNPNPTPVCPACNFEGISIISITPVTQIAFRFPVRNVVNMTDWVIFFFLFFLFTSTPRLFLFFASSLSSLGSMLWYELILREPTQHNRLGSTGVESRFSPSHFLHTLF
jgi:hypothetical protein